MDKTKSNSNVGLILNIIAGIAIILSLIPSIPYRSYFSAIAMFAGIFAYHNNKKSLGVILTIIAMILMTYFIVSGFMGIAFISKLGNI
ncbi:hypothetical protein [Loigolactobacillus backii]|uniref:hypothetical protein n=1 Tax=Loigolactobacillus backii TaxID=375175 RepID=UPI0022FD5D17|nr:hypothetical protein [Loigolactobacillus backii]MDA5386488.1 hypothetical protein [Loigolactobacillus backii]MDA5389015.1 hypothetical protein [Loigolactobacillus backii]